MVRNIVFAGAAVSAAGLGLTYVRHLVGMDPFARLGSEREIEDIAIKLEDVKMRRYAEGKLVAEANIDEVSVNRSRQKFDLSKITNGVYYGEEGKIEFSADTAEWNNSTLQLMVKSPANVKGKDFDLNVTEFHFDQRTSTLRVPTEIKGKLKDGDVVAQEFQYNTKTDEYSVGPARWTGMAALSLEENQDAPKSKWTFVTGGILSSSAGVQHTQNIKATDGEIWVSGDKSQRVIRTDVLTVTGNVLYFSPKVNIACEKVVIDRVNKTVKASGNVRMLIKPKDSMEKSLKLDLSSVPGEVPPFRPVVPDEVQTSRPSAAQTEEEKKLDEEVRSGKNTRKYPTVVLAEKVDYWYAKGSRRAEFSGKPQARQELAGGRWRQVWATTGKYDGEKELLRMIGTDREPIRFRSSLEDDVLAAWFEFSTKEDADILEYSGAEMRGDFAKLDDDPTLEEEETPPASPPPSR